MAPPIWLGAQRTVLTRMLGPGPDAAEAVALATAHLAPATLTTYDSAFRVFAAYCRSQRLSAFPAEEGTVARFLGYLARTRRLQPESAQRYLTAINAVHRSVLLTPVGPAVTALTKQILRGWQLRRAAATPDARQLQRVPLPAYVAALALRRVLAEPVNPDSGGAGSSVGQLPLPTIRALVYVVLGFQLMARASTDASLRVSDVQLTGSALTIQLRKEKGHDADGASRALVLPLPAAGAVAAVVAYWLTRRDLAWRDVPAASPLRRAPVPRPGGLARPAPCSLFFALPSDGAAAAETAPSVLCNSWLQLACRALGVAPPADGAWLSHSLRSGAASAAAAVGVDLVRIRYYGGWAAGSDAVYRYVHATVRPDDAARLFFGWLTSRGASV